MRGGRYANTVFNTTVLATKAHSDSTYRRRALVKFDTESRVPARAQISSATLTLTLKTSERSSRTIGAYSVTTSFDERAATWYRRKTSTSWRSSGGDLGSLYDETTVGSTPGTRVSFDVTRLVQAAVNASGSRYSRIALIDRRGSRASLKQYHSSEASDPATRPTLTVEWGGSSTASAPPPASTSTSTSTLKVLHWNTHYGIGTDGRYDINRIADWIVRINPDVVSLNEVEKYVSGHGNEDQPARYAALLRAKTGRTWYYVFAQRYGNWSSNGGGNLILSRFPIGSTARLEMTCSNRSAALATIVVNGRNVNVVSTHIDSGSWSCRYSELRQLLPWLRGFSDQIILAGDFNASIN
ncbi:MAG: DNRLRE domain-containing protein, partial [Steroidobacteraceae bacterium]